VISALLAALTFSLVPPAVVPPESLLEPLAPFDLSGEIPGEDRTDRLELPTREQPRGWTEKRYLRSTLETALLLGGGTWWYWSGKPPSDGWDLGFDWKSWGRKMDGDAIRFDTDMFETNASSHPRAGAGYYQVARGNGLSYAESYISTFIASAVWEYVVEWIEYPSINDIILTPAAGSVLGESTFRLGRFFDAGSPNLANRLGAVVFSPFAALNDYVAGRKPGAGSEPPYDALGFTSTMQHKFLLGFDRIACFTNGERQDQSTYSLDTSLVSYRGYRRPGSRSVNVSPGDWTELAGRMFVGPSGEVDGIDIHSDTLIAGRYIRRYAERGLDETWRTARPRGWGALLGVGSSFDYDTRTLEQGIDKVASAGLVGPKLELTADRGPFGLRLAVSSYYAFAMVEPMAFLMNGNPTTSLTINSTLTSHGYYYAHGATSAAALDLRLGPFDLGLRATFGAYWGITGRDRYQERIEMAISPFDTRANGVAVLSLRPFGGPVRLSARVERVQRYGTGDGVTGRSDEDRAGLGAGFSF
jgi:hypothetical protein